MGVKSLKYVYIILLLINEINLIIISTSIVGGTSTSVDLYP